MNTGGTGFMSDVPAGAIGAFYTADPSQGPPYYNIVMFDPRQTGDSSGGGIGGMTVGLVSSVVLAMIGPAMRGADALWPLVNPTIVSMPLGFLGAILGTFMWGRDAENEQRFDAFLLQVHTGVTPR